jgi:hypothetical protein
MERRTPSRVAVLISESLAVAAAPPQGADDDDDEDSNGDNDNGTTNNRSSRRSFQSALDVREVCGVVPAVLGDKKLGWASTNSSSSSNNSSSSSSGSGGGGGSDGGGRGAVVVLVGMGEMLRPLLTSLSARRTTDAASGGVLTSVGGSGCDGWTSGLVVGSLNSLVVGASAAVQKGISSNPQPKGGLSPSQLSFDVETLPWLHASVDSFEHKASKKLFAGFTESGADDDGGDLMGGRGGYGGSGGIDENGEGPEEFGSPSDQRSARTTSKTTSKKAKATKATTTKKKAKKKGSGSDDDGDADDDDDEGDAFAAAALMMSPRTLASTEAALVADVTSLPSLKVGTTLNILTLENHTLCVLSCSILCFVSVSVFCQHFSTYLF